MERIKRLKINGVEYSIDGDSAYEVAVENGFEGTEEEWLESLTEQTKKNAEEVIEEANKAVDRIGDAEKDAVDLIDKTSEEIIFSKVGIERGTGKNGVQQSGSSNITRGNNAATFGLKNESTRGQSLTAGLGNKNKTAQSIVVGYQLRTSTKTDDSVLGQAVFGKYNKVDESDEFVQRAMFGCGKSDTERANSFEVREYADGRRSILVGDIEITDEQLEKLLTSIAIGTMAISDATTAFGINTIAGCKGYYWTAFDSTSNKITLSGSQTEQTDIGTLNWQVGDTISIDNHNKWDACGKIIEVGADYIIVDTLPFTERVADQDELTWDDYAIFNIDRPAEGIIDLGKSAFAIGTDTKAIGWQSYAEGVDTKSIGRASHAEGRETTAVYCAHAEGRQTEALGHESHAEGKNTKALAMAAHAEGYYTEATAEGAHAEGGYTKATDVYAHTEGYKTEAAADAAHAEGNATKAYGNYSHAEGFKSIANAKWSHAEGGETQANGEVSHAEGYKTITEGGASHAEGQETKAIGQFSHAGGFKSEVSGKSAFGHGTHVKTTNQGEAAFGNYNKTGENTLFSIGCGKSDTERANSFEVRKYTDGHSSILLGDVEITDEQITKLLSLLPSEG